MNSQETLSFLRSAFDAEQGSFLARLRGDLDWDQQAFSRLDESAYERLHDLAYWLFQGESPYKGGSGFEELVP